MNYSYIHISKHICMLCHMPVGHILASRLTFCLQLKYSLYRTLSMLTINLAQRPNDSPFAVETYSMCALLLLAPDSKDTR